MTIKNNQGKPLTISWSGYETFNDCPRKWYYGYMDRIRTSSQATEVGSHVHDLAEDYLNGEVDVDDPVVQASRWFRILKPGLCYAPTPEEVVAEGWGVENWLQMQCGPLPFSGKVDFYNIEKRKVCDWKTTGFKDFRYAKTPRALAGHGQPLVYTYALFHEDPPASVEFQHINLLTKGKPDAMEVWTPTPVPWEDAVAMWAVMEEAAGKMAAIATNHKDASTVPPATGACKKFGGCPHAAYCSASPVNRNNNLKPTPLGEKLMANTPGTNSRLAGLRAKLGVVETDVAEVPAPPPPKPQVSDADNLAKAIQQAQMLLAAVGSLPEAVLKSIAESCGVLPFQVMEALNLHLVEGSFHPKPEPAPEPEAVAPVKLHLEPGTPTRDAVALVEGQGLDLAEQFERNQLKNVGGILVPLSFEGGVVAAYTAYRPGTPEAAVAETIQEVDQTPVPPKAAKGTPGVTGPDDDRKAADHLVERLTQHGSPQSKTKASEWVKEVLDLRRVRQGRWDSIIAASDGQLAGFEEGTLSLTAAAAAPTSEPEVTPVAEAVEEQPAPDDVSEVAAEAAIEEKAPPAQPDPVEAQPILGVDDLPPEIFVDAIPLNDDYIDFSEWVHPFELEVAAENGLPYYGLVGYGQGTKQVVAKVIAAVHAYGAGALPDCTMVIDSFHPLAAEVTPVLNRIPGVRWVKGRR